jgi:hypothetical protein
MIYISLGKKLDPISKKEEKGMRYGSSDREYA